MFPSGASSRPKSVGILNRCRTTARCGSSVYLVTCLMGTAVERRLSTGSILKMVEDAHGDGVFARRQICECEFVAFVRRVAQPSGWINDCPIAAVEAVLRPLDGAQGVARLEADGNTFNVSAPPARDTPLCAPLLDQWRRVGHFQPLAGALRGERVARRVGRGHRTDHLHRGGPVG